MQIWVIFIYRIRFWNFIFLDDWSLADTIEFYDLVVSVLGTIVSFVGTIGVLVTLFYISRQTKLSREQIAILSDQTEAARKQVDILSDQTEAARKQVDILSDHTDKLTKALEGNTYASITNNLALTKQIFIEHPELRSYFYEGKPIPKDHPKYKLAEGIAEHLLDFFDGVLHQDNKLWAGKYWLRYFHDSFKNSPILCEYLESHRLWYSTKVYIRFVKTLPLERRRIILKKNRAMQRRKISTP